jgi:hypothetical protein
MSTNTLPDARSADAPGGPVHRIDGPPRRGPGFARLVALEVRKSVDTRAGRWVLATILGLAVLALGWEIWQSRSNPVSLAGFAESAETPVVLLLPVIGILAMTSEWTQRTALTTFTLSPRRLPVLLAKLVAALAVSLAMIAAVAVLVGVATAIGGWVSDGPVEWSMTWRTAAGVPAINGLNVLMGAGIGALIPITGVALTTFYVAPALLSFATSTILVDHGEWVDIFSAFNRIAAFDLAGQTSQTMTAVALWVVLPMVLGLWSSLRREVK